MNKTNLEVVLMNEHAGDPLSPSFGPPSKFLRNLQRWLYDGVGIKCTNDGNCLTHGSQNDWFSCGVVLPNTIAHSIFGDSIWIPRRAVLDRVNWFLTLAKGVKTEKCTPDLDGQKATAEVSSY
jgi:hypothetical protein